jgi:hypothetical protein
MVNQLSPLFTKYHTFAAANKMGRIYLNLENDEEMGLGVPAKAISVSVLSLIGTVTMGISFDGLSYGRIVKISGDSSFGFDYWDNTCASMIYLEADAAAVEIEVLASAGRWEDGELESYNERFRKG